MAQDDKWFQQIFVRGDDVVQVLATADKMFKAFAKEMMSTSSLSREMDPWGTVCFKSQIFIHSAAMAVLCILIMCLGEGMLLLLTVSQALFPMMLLFPWGKYFLFSERMPSVWWPFVQTRGLVISALDAWTQSQLCLCCYLLLILRAWKVHTIDCVQFILRASWVWGFSPFSSGVQETYCVACIIQR